jgi:hypothetical protein
LAKQRNHALRLFGVPERKNARPERDRQHTQGKDHMPGLATVTPFRRRQEISREIGKEYTFKNIYELCAFVQSEILNSKLKYAEIARRADCCAQTVSNMASGETQQPRASTVLSILGALGFQWIARQ